MNATDATVALACALIERASVTPDDGGCQALLAGRLARHGFSAEHMPFGAVSNVWLRRGHEAPLVCFAGHTDVVPTGPVERWSSDPFSPEIRDGLLYGRGAADMKGGIAAFVTACERFLADCPDHRGSIALLLTSDEEGPAIDGTRRVIERLQARGEHIDWCLVGEPSSQERLGDTVRRGRRGSLNGRLRVSGRQGHVAYPDKALNPIHAVLPLLLELTRQRWEEDSASGAFPPTSFQIANIRAGTGASNVIPGELVADFNLRYSTAWTATGLQEHIEQRIAAHGLRAEVDWHVSAHPFLTEGTTLLDAVSASVEEQTGLRPDPSTGGGTSDGRFIAPTGAEVIELGVVNASIHQIDEHAAVADLVQLSRIHEAVLHRLLGPQAGNRASTQPRRA